MNHLTTIAMTALAAGLSASPCLAQAEYYGFHQTGAGIPGAVAPGDITEFTVADPFVWSGTQCGSYNVDTCIDSCDGSEPRHWGEGAVAAGPGFVSVDTTSHRGCLSFAQPQTSTIGRAWMTLDDVVFSSATTQTITVTMYIRVNMSLFTSSNSLGKNYCQLIVRENGSNKLNESFNSNSLAPWYISNTDVILPITFQTQTNEPRSIGIRFQLSSEAWEFTNGGISITNRTYGEVSFVSSQPVFDLPAGVTVNSAQGNIIDNMWSAPTDPCPGDANGDNITNFDDLTLVLGNFGLTVAPGDSGDVNADGIVNFDDLTAVLGNFGLDCN